MKSKIKGNIDYIIYSFNIKNERKTNVRKNEIDCEEESVKARPQEAKENNLHQENQNRDCHEQYLLSLITVKTTYLVDKSRDLLEYFICTTTKGYGGGYIKIGFRGKALIIF